MGLIPIIVLLAAVWYFTKPEERARFRRAAIGRTGDVWDVAARYWPKRLPFDDVLDARTPQPLVTPAIIALNVGIFVCMVFGPGSLADQETAVRWGGTIGTRMANGEWWRLATAMFVHTGPLHLLANVAGLVVVGLLTERLFGRVAFANVYLGAGLLGTAINLLLHPVAVSAGGSASVFAVYGLFAAALIGGVAFPSELSIPPTTLLKVAPGAALFLLYSLAAGFAGAAEMAGLVAGLVYGCVLAKDLPARTPPHLRVAVPSALVLALTVAAAWPFHNVSDARPEIEQVAAVEQQTASAYDAAVRQFTNGQMSLGELVALIDRKILPELTAAHARLKRLGRVLPGQATLVAGADEYFKLREESWRARAAGLRRTSLAGMRSPDDTERAAREVLEGILPPEHQ